MSWLGIPFATNHTLLWLWSFYFYIYRCHCDDSISVFICRVTHVKSIVFALFFVFMYDTELSKFLLQFLNVTSSLLFLTNFAFSIGYCSHIMFCLMLSSSSLSNIWAEHQHRSSNQCTFMHTLMKAFFVDSEHKKKADFNSVLEKQYSTNTFFNERTTGLIVIMFWLFCIFCYHTSA